MQVRIEREVLAKKMSKPHEKASTS